MRLNPPGPAHHADHVMLVGSGEAAMAALWSLAAAGAQIHWYVDRADVGAETVLASGLGGCRLNLFFGDPPTAPLDGIAAVVAARGDTGDLRIGERARASRIPVHVAGRPDLSTMALAGCGAAARRESIAQRQPTWAAATS